MPESEIKKTCEENIAGIEAVFNHTRPYGTCFCDDQPVFYDQPTNQYTCGDQIVTPPPIFSTEPLVTDKFHNCCEKIVVGSKMGDIQGNYIQGKIFRDRLIDTPNCGVSAPLKQKPNLI